MNKEQIHDKKINPLMAKIISICTEHGIAMRGAFEVFVIVRWNGKAGEHEMSLQYLTDNEGRITGVLTLADIYRYKGFTFQVHYYCGPMKLKKDLSDASRIGRRFYKTWEEWDKLSKKEKEATRI